jgi:hypothetical protein
MKKLAKNVEASIDEFIEGAEKEEGKENAIFSLLVSETGDSYQAHVYGNGGSIVNMMLMACKEDSTNEALICQTAANLMSIDELESIIEQKKAQKLNSNN